MRDLPSVFGVVRLNSSSHVMVIPSTGYFHTGTSDGSRDFPDISSSLSCRIIITIFPFGYMGFFYQIEFIILRKEGFIGPLTSL
jgi:hypothetical protein